MVRFHVESFGLRNQDIARHEQKKISMPLKQLPIRYFGIEL